MTVFTRNHVFRFSDCDPAGIVFFPQYFVMFNGLVEDWVNDGLGLDYRALIMDRKVGLPTVHLETDFSAVSRLGDVVTLSLRVVRLGNRSFTLDLRCEGETGELRASVLQVIVTTSLATHSSIEIPTDLRAAIERTTGPL